VCRPLTVTLSHFSSANQRIARAALGPSRQRLLQGKRKRNHGNDPAAHAHMGRGEDDPQHMGPLKKFA